MSASDSPIPDRPARGARHASIRRGAGRPRAAPVAHVARSSGRARWRWLPGASLLLLALLPSYGNAQSVSGGSSGGSDAVVERERVERTAHRSYDETLVRRAKNVLGKLEDYDYDVPLDKVVENAKRRYRDELTAKLDELEGDGIILRSEISEALAPIRERHLARFEDVITAHDQGFDAPPFQDEFESTGGFALALLRYSVLVRNPPWYWLRFAGCIVGGFALAWALAKLLERTVHRVDSADKGMLIRSAAAIRTPLLIASATGGLLLGMSFLWVSATVSSVVVPSLQIVLLALLLWGLWNLCYLASALIVRLLAGSADIHAGEHLRMFIRRMIRIALVVAFVLIAIKIILDADFGQIFTGLGIAGVALWFVMRGMIANVTASFTLFADQSLRIGDLIIYEGRKGDVENIGFRATQIRTWDGHLLTVPNREMIESTIENLSARPSIRRTFHIGVEYGTPPGKIEKAIELVKASVEHYRERLAEGSDVHAVLQNFGAYDLQIYVVYFTRSTEYWEAQNLHSDINREIIARWGDAGIAVPFPTQTTILKSEEGATPRMSLVGQEGKG